MSATGPLPVVPLAPPPDGPLKLDQSGPYAPLVTRIPTDKKIVFITMDDGTTQAPVAQDLFRESKLPVTMFLISHTAASNPKYFKGLVQKGARVEDHTVTHPMMNLNKRSALYQKNQICGASKQLKGIFGIQPTLFRPPYGLYNETTLKIAHDCGIHAVVMWEGSMIGGGLFINQHEVGPRNPLKPGMILLMHFTPHFNEDYRVLLAAIAKSGYSVGRLTDYLQ